jgi:predicted ester cyclase
MGQPPTGQHFSVTSINIFRIRNGQIVEHWGVFDQMGMLAQLRVFPSIR